MDEDDEGSGENDYYILVNTSYFILYDKMTSTTRVTASDHNQRLRAECDKDRSSR